MKHLSLFALTALLLFNGCHCTTVAPSSAPATTPAATNPATSASSAAASTAAITASTTSAAAATSSSSVYQLLCAGVVTWTLSLVHWRN